MQGSRNHSKDTGRAPGPLFLGERKGGHFRKLKGRWNRAEFYLGGNEVLLGLQFAVQYGGVTNSGDAT